MINILIYSIDISAIVLNSILNKALDAQRAALAAKAAREMVRRKSLLTSTVLPGKLADCSSSNPAGVNTVNFAKICLIFE